MTLWEVDILPADRQPDLEARRVASQAVDLGMGASITLRTARGYLLEGDLKEAQIQFAAASLLADSVVESTRYFRVDVESNGAPEAGSAVLIDVLPKPGVMDPVAQSALQALSEIPLPVTAVRTVRKYWVDGLSSADVAALCKRVLANDSVEQVVLGPLKMDRLHIGQPYQFERLSVSIRDMQADELDELSRKGQLYLTRIEMQTIQAHFRQLERDPTDVELETIAQTWSEHCSHKTLAGRIAYRDENGERQFENMLKETIFAATSNIRQQLGDRDWCVSVFEDNAGIVRFDDEFNVVFKVETHNHPSALEPYGGANTGIGGVIRDPLGTGLGARPVCNTDVFCFAPPDTPPAAIPPGVLHPQRVMKGVVAGVRDYGNRMGIPTVNGAIYFDPRYLGNPLVYCGNVGIIPRDCSRKAPQVDDFIVAIGGRTGRDGIHGATFSSAELTSDSETLSGGAVQIGNAITEKMLQDVLLAARDRNLFNAVTDCGAGGFSSAIGEMGEKIGAEVWLEKAPLKYEGLTYTEIWISEAQERMVLAVPPAKWDAFHQLCASEGVEATVLGRFVATGKLVLHYDGNQVADLSMRFLHEGRPPIVRQAEYRPQPVSTFDIGAVEQLDANQVLQDLLASLNVASKEWVIRQYDHEVQGGSVIKPLVGISNDGPSDAAVIRPNIRSKRGLAISCGMNPRFGDLDPYHMAASAIDEALRNCVAVGASPDQIAILDNFCWGYTDRPETLGTLVRAALACHDVAVALKTPFISGKDSLNNEFSYIDAAGAKQTIAIPPSLLISAMGQINNVELCTTMDFKQPGSLICLVGETKQELGGSHLALVTGIAGGLVPQVDTARAKATFEAVHRAITAGSVLACHDLSEGGLGVSVAEMAFAGGLGARLYLDQVPHRLRPADAVPAILVFAESNTRFLCEVAPEQIESFTGLFAEVPMSVVGEVVAEPELRIFAKAEHATRGVPPYILAELSQLKRAWQAPLAW